MARNAVGIFDAAVCLLSEIDRLEQLDQAVLSTDHLRVNAEAQRYMDHNQAQAARINTTLQELRSMPWDALVEHGVSAGSRLLADLIVFKGISLGGNALRSITPKIDALIDAARSEKFVASAGGVNATGMETIETFAVAGKVAADEGVDVAEHVSELIRSNSKIIEDGKSFGQAVQSNTVDSF